MCIRIRVCIYVVCVSVCVRMCVCVFVCVCIYVCVCVGVCVGVMFSGSMQWMLLCVSIFGYQFQCMNVFLWMKPKVEIY